MSWQRAKQLSGLKADKSINMTKPKNRRVRISFYTKGYVETEVEIPAKMTNKELGDGLNRGDLFTSINRGENLVNLVPRFEKIGRIIEITNSDCENDDFSVSEIDLSPEEKEADEYKTNKRISD